jgi:endonuclease/exonuclease/phosphatase family metal-dependent hydrolase
LAQTDRPGTLIPAAALVALLFIDVLRIWLPAVLVGLDLTPVGRAGVVVGVTIVAPIVASVLPRRLVTGTWVGTLGLLLFTRLLLQTDIGGVTLAVVASVAVMAATLMIAVLARSDLRPSTTRLSLFVGFAAAATVHTGLAMTDLAWRTGFLSWATLLVQLGVTAAAAWRLRTTLTASDEPGSGAGWPWWLLGPILLLLWLLVLVPGRLATATRWSDPWIAFTVVSAAGFGVAAVLVGRWIGHSLAGPIGAGLVLVGTTGALQAHSTLAVLSQFTLAAGLGLVLAATERVPRTLPPRRTGIAAAGFPALFCVLALAYYAAYGVVVPFPNRLVLLLIALFVGVAGLVAGAARDASVPWTRDAVTRPLTGTAVATITLGLLASFLVGGPVRGPGSPGAEGDPIRVALVNLQSGFDGDGRFSIPKVADMLAEHDPDIVVLNEVDRGWLVTGGHDTLRQVSGALGMSYVFGPSADEVWGNAILSRYPVSEAVVERLPRGRDPMDRSQLVAVLQVTEESQIAIIATHLGQVDQQGDTRLPQARSVAATLVRLRDRGVPVVLAGTLYAEPGSAELGTMTDAARSVLPDGHPTWPAAAPEFQFGHILTTADLRVRDQQVVDVQLSDHLPVITTLELIPSS